RHPGVAQLLLQVADDRPGTLSRTRPLHSIHEVEEHPALDDGQRVNHPSRPGVLRLNIFWFFQLGRKTAAPSLISDSSFIILSRRSSPLGRPARASNKSPPLPRSSPP